MGARFLGATLRGYIVPITVAPFASHTRMTASTVALLAADAWNLHLNPRTKNGLSALGKRRAKVVFAAPDLKQANVIT